MVDRLARAGAAVDRGTVSEPGDALNPVTHACSGVLFRYHIRLEGDGVPQNRREADDSCHAEDAGGSVMCLTTNAVLFLDLPPRLFVDKPVRARDRAASLDNLNPAFESLS